MSKKGVRRDCLFTITVREELLAGPCSAHIRAFKMTSLNAGISK
jgi:hypothetical protein